MAPSGSRAGVRYSGGLSVPLRRLWPVLSTIDLRGSAGPGADYAAAVPRAGFDVAAAVERVLPICADVAARGEAALAEYSERFDHVVPEHFRVPASALEQAAASLDPDLRKAFEVSIARRRTVSAAELGEAEVRVELAPGRGGHPADDRGRPGRAVRPGGLAPLASSVIMNVVPAQVAGVRSIALSSPPQREFGGLPHPSILAVCHLLGIEEVYAVGGAQAIAMFAYGVSGLCDRVDLVTGPGNIYVVAAKRAPEGPGEHRLRGRSDRDRDPGRRDRRPGARRRRPDLPGRARPARRRRAGHRQRGAGRGRPRRGRAPGAGDQAQRADRAVAGRRAVRDRAGARCGPGDRGRRRVRRRAPRDPDRAAPPRSRPGSATPGRSSSAVGRRCRSATTRPEAPTCCRPAAAPATAPG